MKIAAFSFLMIITVGVLDYYTGTEISLTLFYLIPVTLCSWYVNRKTAFVAAIICGLTALLSDAAFGRNLLAVFWNTSVRTSIFILSVLLLTALKNSQLQLKRSENELKKTAEELRRSNQELEQFASSASHDLQEPLRKIVTFGDRIDIKMSALSDLEIEYFEKMKQAAIRMQKLIHDLLQLSKVSSNALIRLEEVDLNKVLEEVQEDLELRLIESGGYIETCRLPRVKAEPLQMRQLFLNLLSNALKYRKKTEPPKIRINAKSTDNGYIEIKVRDNGIGFDEKDLDRIFRPFDRLHNKSEFEGTGLGLPICRKIVQRYGGSLTAAGVKGEGATFIIKLPVLREN